MLQYGFIEYILGYNMGTFEFPTTEILVSTCILNYKTYYQFAFEIGSIYTSINNIQITYLFTLLIVFHLSYLQKSKKVSKTLLTM